jgi:protein O-GlcNAc transferase
MKLLDLCRSKLWGSAAPADSHPRTGAETLTADASLRHAQTLLGDGRLAEATSIYRAVLARDPQHWASASALASIALQTGKLENAIQLYSALIERRPDFVEGYYKRGNAHNKLESWSAALADYDRAIALDPRFANASCNRGAVLERLARWNDALASYNRALELNPKDAFAHYNRAGALRELRRFDDAISSYDQAIALNDGYVAAYVNRGHLLHKLSRHMEAAASYDKALELNPIVTRASESGPLGALTPEQKYLLGLKRHVQMQICDWEGMNADLERIAAGLRAQLPMTLPFPLLAMLHDPALHRAAAQSRIREESPPDPSLGDIPSRARSSKIRVGYFSADFPRHSTASSTCARVRMPRLPAWRAIWGSILRSI